MTKFKTNYSEPLIKPYITGEPGKVQQQWLDANNPHSVVQRHALTSRIPTYVNTYDYTPDTVHQQIKELTETLDKETKEIEKQKNEENEKNEKALKEKIRKEINDERTTNSESNKKRTNQSSTES